MSISFFSAKNYSTKLKATIQSSGRLGFTYETARILGLSEDSYIKLGADGLNTDVMYMVLCGKEDDAFRVGKSGSYYFLPTTILFMSLNIDFRSNTKTIIFDLTRASEMDDELGGLVYKMTKREKKRRKKEVER